ncbi:MAG: family 16 glycosylhydrolase [Armatimonadetes bacterium]|nr:family 16 glycosylhydrolase [Armatimonadota bacterium]
MNGCNVLILSVALCAGVGAIARAADPAKSSGAPSTLAGCEFLTVPGRLWKLLWHDEFNGTRLDESKWTLGLPWTGDDGTNRHHNSQYASYIMDDDVNVSGGALHLTTQRRDVKNPSGRVYHFTEGLITTSEKFDATYGYFEIRAKLPTEAGPGTWPAFWMLSKGWPPEMDVIEYWGSDSRIHQGTVTRKPDGGQRWDSYHRHHVSLSGWHTYGLEWGPGYQIYNIDGDVTLAVYGDHLPQVPHYLLLNSGVETGRPPRPGTTFPNDFVVDYVRVYARPTVSALLNGGFEGESLAPWSRMGESAIVDYGARTGNRVLRADSGVSLKETKGTERSGAQQTVYGLEPGAEYRLSAWVRTTGESAALLGVKGSGEREQVTPGRRSSRWIRESLTFTPETNASSATIFLASQGGGTAYFDDVRVERIAP